MNTYTNQLAHKIAIISVLIAMFVVPIYLMHFKSLSLEEYMLGAAIKSTEISPTQGDTKSLSVAGNSFVGGTAR